MAQLVISDIRQTCTACPSQWEAVTTNNRPVYIRYRHGYLSVQIGFAGGDMKTALDSEEWFGKQLFDEDDGWIEFDEVCRIANISIVASHGSS